MIGFGIIFSKMATLTFKILIREKNVRVWSIAAARSKEIRVLIL
jgi:hypothetical protein